MPSPRRWTQLLTLLLLAGCLRTVPIPEGDVVATLTLPTSTNEPFDPETLRGKPTLVVFASPTCPYCAEELPAAQAAARAKDANVVAVFVAGGAKHAASMTKSIGFTATALVDDGRLRKLYKVEKVPHTLVLDAYGRARDAFRGTRNESALRHALDDAR